MRDALWFRIVTRPSTAVPNPPPPPSPPLRLLPEMSVVPGKLLGSYRMVDVVGEGSFGQVWKARKVGALQTVAIKLIPKAGKKEKEIQGLRQEIDILKTLRHENIIQMLDAFETPSDFCVVTEFAQGELFEILESDTSLSEEVVQTIAKQLVAALHYLHSNRIIHRDMKPQNILISADGTVKLCDFGFARAMSQDTFVLTSIKGTPLYMAPELVQEQPYTPAVDVWSMGVILYELFVGKPPFYTTSIYKLIKQIVNQAPVYPSAMSNNFKSFLQRVLEKDPKKRLGWPELLRHPFVSSGDAVDVDKRIDQHRPEDEQQMIDIFQSTETTRSTRSTRSARSDPRSDVVDDEVGGQPSMRTHLAASPFAPASRSRSPTKEAVARALPISNIDKTVNATTNATTNAARTAGAVTPIAAKRMNKTNKTQEPTFLDPPQFSPQGSLSPSDGPMGSAIADRLPSGTVPQSPPVIALLVDAERRVQRGVEGPGRIVTDPAIHEAITSALNPPSGGRGLTAWCKLQETQYVVTLLDRVLGKIPKGVSLQEIDPSGKLTSILVLLAKAGHLCVGTNPQFAGAAASALRKCDDWVVCLETASLCSELISSRGSWAVAIEGCEGIRVWAVRAQCALLGPSTSSSLSPSSSSSRGMAQKLVDRFVTKKLPGRLCRCIEDYDSASGGYTSAEDKLVVSALEALATMLPCVHDGVPGCACGVDSTPSKNQAPSTLSKPLAALTPSTPSSLPALWTLAARCVFESKETLNCLVRVIPRSPFTTMSIRLVRLEPRLGRILLLNRIPDSVLESTRRDSAALLGKEIFDSVASTCPGSDIAFLEQQCGARLSAAVKREWMPSLSSAGAELRASSSACGAIASYTLLFHRYWSAGTLYSHINALKGRLVDIKAICSGGSELDTTGKSVLAELGGAEGLPSTIHVRDGAFELAYVIAALDHKQATAFGLVDAAMDVVVDSAVSGQGDLSPAGIAACLKTLQIGAENDAGTLERIVARDGVTEALVSFLSPEFASRTAAFYGEGAGDAGDKRAWAVLGAARVAVLAIIQAPLVHAPMLCGDPDAVAKAYKRQLGTAMWPEDADDADGTCSKPALIPSVVNILREIRRDNRSTTATMATTVDPSNTILTSASTSGIADSVLPACAAVLARMTLTFGDDAVVTFARSGGLDSVVLENLLSVRNPEAMLGSSLLVVSQLARTATSKSQIERFVEAGIMPLIPPLLEHPTSCGVRARACNLLGNLCRQSDEVYPSIRELRILSPLIDLCSDEDQSTRKFACFAIGNAGFHSDFLYEDLRPAVRTLVHLLEDEEDRTVANAAGALGNLVRNSGDLVSEMLACGAVEALLAIIARGGSTSAASTASTASTAFQISLFSLGNLAAHRECRETLQGLGIADVMAGIQRNPSVSKSAAKYASRVLSKMGGIGGSGGVDEGNDSEKSVRPVVQQTPFVPSKSRPRDRTENEAEDDF